MVKLAALLLTLALFSPNVTMAEPVRVRFAEGVTHGFPVLRSEAGKLLAQGELTQVPLGDRIESRLVFHFDDGSLYDETVVFQQRDTFRLLSYHLIQRGPSFPETLDGRFDRETGRYDVTYREDDDSPLTSYSGKVSLPDDVYNGLLGTLLKNLQSGEKNTVKIVAFTPKPRVVEILLAPVGSDHLEIGKLGVPATRYMVKPQLGMLASLLVTDLPPTFVWIARGDAPGFVRFEGALYFMGPVWRIEIN